MNFNYDLATWIDYFTGAFICCFGSLIVGKILLNKKFKDINKWKLILLVPLTVFTIFNTLAFDNILKMFGILIVIFVIFKFILEEKGSKIFVYSIVTHIIVLLGEVAFAIIISILDYVFKTNIASNVSNATYSNIIIVIFAYVIASLLSKKIRYYIEKIIKAHMIISFIQFLLTLFIIISCINYLYIEKWKFSYKFILIAIIILSSTIITYILMKQYLKNKEVVEKYKMSREYLQTSAYLIEKYSMMIHKYKNNLVIIKGYIKSDTSEATKYIDSLLEKVEDKKYSWVKKINNISIDTMRYFIYYKLLQAEESNLKIFVNVNKDIKTIDDKVFISNELGHILDVLGEYFDNAIYASSESKEKELTFDLYKENENLVFNISNTYKDKVNLNLITKNGYTTKGKGHGMGLYGIEKTIKNLDILSNKYELIDKCFVATLFINLNNKKTKHKK